MIKSSRKVGIIGLGSWGTAIASILATNNERVICYTRNEQIAQGINTLHINEKSFPNITLPNNIVATHNFGDLLDSNFLCLAIPTQHIRGILDSLNKLYGPLTLPIIICSKGLENDSCKLISQILDEINIKSPMAILSGPNFAIEVMLGKQTFTTIACSDTKLAKQLLKSFSTPYFTVEVIEDLIGTQICGAFKNVIAIAAGINLGLDLGSNSYAALLTHGLNEMRMLIKAMGGDIATINSFAGLGDLILTCGSVTSRNTNFGYQLGKTGNRSFSSTVEGFHSTKAFKRVTDLLKIQLTILNQVYSILYEGEDPKIIANAIIANTI